MPDPTSREGLPRTAVALAFLILVSLGIVRIAATYHTFSQTFDEPATVAAGMEWIDHGTYTIDPSNPPLARIAAALGPFLTGLHLPTVASGWSDFGNQILYARNEYSRNLALARMGVLPFFFLAAGALFIWSRKVFGNPSALLTTLLFTTLPAVLAHAGLATTDMALAAMFTSAMLAFMVWLERPTYFTSAVLGLTAALTILSKFSALLFLPACGSAMVICRWVIEREADRAQVDWRRRAAFLALIFTTSFAVIWGGYRFSVHRTYRAERPHENIDSWVGSEGSLHRLAYVVAEHVPIPAPELGTGITWQRLHSARGARNYLLGRVSTRGSWYFFPLVLAVKSPLPFLILTGLGLFFLGGYVRQSNDWRALAPAAMAAALLLVSMPSTIDLGVRLILPIYPLLAMVAGFGGVQLWKLRKPRLVGPAVVVILVLWQVFTSVRAHPDYLPYFNELAGTHPEKIVVDSDLDWGQDLLRLADELRTRRIDSVAVAYFGTADLSRHGLPTFRRLAPYQRTSGWIAISQSMLKFGEGEPPYQGYAWLESRKPATLIGRSILLYYLNPGDADASGQH